MVKYHIPLINLLSSPFDASFLNVYTFPLVKNVPIFINTSAQNLPLRRFSRFFPKHK